MQVQVTKPVLESNAPATSRRQHALRLALVLAFTLTLTALVIQFQDEIRGLRGLGYPGVFLISLLSNATVVFPAPGLAFTFAMGGVLNPIAVGLVAGIGETLGELTGYAAGRAGRGTITGNVHYGRLEELTRRYGALAVFFLAAVPAAVFDLVGLAAGAMRMPLPRFLLCTWLGKTIKTVVFAHAGVFSITWLSQLIG